jgi:hypothetical protein
MQEQSRNPQSPLEAVTLHATIWVICAAAT